MTRFLEIWSADHRKSCHHLTRFFWHQKNLVKWCTILWSMDAGHRHLKFSRRQQKLCCMGDNQDSRTFSISNPCLSAKDIFCPIFLSTLGRQDGTKATWGLLNTICVDPWLLASWIGQCNIWARIWAMSSQFSWHTCARMSKWKIIITAVIDVAGTVL